MYSGKVQYDYIKHKNLKIYCLAILIQIWDVGLGDVLKFNI